MKRSGPFCVKHFKTACLCLQRTLCPQTHQNKERIPLKHKNYLYKFKYVIGAVSLTKDAVFC